MKAMVINVFGEPEVFQLAEIEKPVPGPDQVLIRVRASSVNPIDVKIRSGAVPAVAPPFPAVLGVDVAGEIVALGSEIKDLSAGDRVAALGGGVKGHDGALAEFMRIDRELIARIPENVTDETAAAMPVVGLTAWEALVNRGKIRPGQHVLIHGGAGGVGHTAVQLASALGAEVTTTVSSDAKAILARKLGAHHVVNYLQQTVKEYVDAYTGGMGYDVILDTVGGENVDKSFEAAGLNGVVISTNTRSTHDLTPMHGKGLTLHVVFLLVPLLFGKEKKTAGENLEKLLNMVAQNKLLPMIHPQVFGFTRIREAHELLQRGDHMGKISLFNDFDTLQ
ncbi:MAG: zinc-dependent alcohol dehydrogenase family protein [Bacillota bacterium]|nr:zinc-dependent alcohol dehydrogenase family protein [Bacillota bacterium]MDW7676872.1 zinc-dependent alcohol dehydrogenase family protein [Bacillota bacterium]